MLFASHMHHKINKLIKDINTNYNLRSNLKRFKTFNIENYEMVWIHPKWFPLKPIKKLHACSVSIFKILNKFKRRCLCKSSKKIGTSSFNVEDLKAYKDPNV